MTCRKSNKAILYKYFEKYCTVRHDTETRTHTHTAPGKQWSAEITRCQKSNTKQQNAEQNNISTEKKRSEIKYMNVVRAVVDVVRKSKCAKLPSNSDADDDDGRQRGCEMSRSAHTHTRTQQTAHENISLKNEIVPNNQSEIDPNCAAPRFCYCAYVCSRSEQRK